MVTVLWLMRMLESKKNHDYGIEKKWSEIPWEYKQSISVLFFLWIVGIGFLFYEVNTLFQIV